MTTPIPTQMIYHCVEPPKNVYDQEDLDFHLAHGWAMSPQKFDLMTAMKAKIAYHRAEAERLQSALNELTEEFAVQKETEESGATAPLKRKYTKRT